MSAIAGVFYLSGKPVDGLAVTRMTEVLAHRGPDGSATWSKGPVSLGHLMLHTTTESLGEKLPTENPSGEIVITADARIDNRDDLLALLDFRGYFSEPITDNQIILAAYEKWGEYCADKLLGDFAFAVWDSRKQRLFCARDPVGVKPFYYYISGDLFAFASEIKALLALTEVPCQINEARIADHLLSNFEDKCSTFYKGIYRLPAAHTFTVTCGASRIRRYWDLNPSREIRLGSDEEYADAFREVFTSAVRSRLRCAFPVGASLSGGLDSSSIACTARNLLAQTEASRLHTFSAIFPNLPQEDMSKIDERHYMKAVLAQGGFLDHLVEADRLGPLTDIDEMLWHEHEAFLAPNLYIHWALYGAARREGVKIFLDGLDGDTTVSHGLEYLGQLARHGKWFKLHREASGLSRKSPNASFTTGRIMWEYGFRNLFPPSAFKFWRSVRGKPQADSSEYELFNPEFARRVGLKEKAQKLMKESLQPGGKLRESHYMSLNSGQIPYTLEVADRACAAFGLEGRYPFFDRRLMEFCLALPPEQKLSRGWTRAVMRRAMSGILPEEVQWRIGKANLSPNFRRRLLDYGKPLIDDLIENEPADISKYFNLSALRDAFKRYSSRPVRSQKDSLTIYNAVMLGCWLRSERENHFSGRRQTVAGQQKAGALRAG